MASSVRNRSSVITLEREEQRAREMTVKCLEL